MELKKQNNNVIWALVTLVVVIAAVAVAGMLLLGHDDESFRDKWRHLNIGFPVRCRVGYCISM